jgi:hypothetical protein
MVRLVPDAAYRALHNYLTSLDPSPPAHAKGGTGSVGLPMDVRVVARKRGPPGSDREDAHRNGGDAHMNGFTVASPQVGPLLHAPPFPAAGASNGEPRANVRLYGRIP